MNWITLDDLLLIHARVIETTGGAMGVVNAGGLESALVRPLTAYGGRELFPNVTGKVAALVHSIIAFHPFADGNKRTALVAGDVCLRLNGFRLTPSEAVAPFFWSIARGEHTIESITAWPEDHTDTLD